MTGTELKRHIIFALTILIGLFVFTLALYGIIQLIGLSKSNNYNYAFTGSFYNPGPYACYLAVGFPIALRMMLSGGSSQDISD